MIAVDPAVDASIDAPDAGCSQQFPDFAVVQLWICSNLDLDAATVTSSASAGSSATVGETCGRRGSGSSAVGIPQRFGSRSTTGEVAAGGRLS